MVTAQLITRTVVVMELASASVPIIKKPFTFTDGAPGGETLKDCNRMLLEATTHVLNASSDASFQYGDVGGCQSFKDELARFLTNEYGAVVKSSNLMQTAGATQGFNMIITLLLEPTAVIFVEDPTYFYAFGMISKDNQRTLIVVPSDDQGPVIAAFEELLLKHRPNHLKSPPGRRFWACFYLMSVYNNPTGQSFSADRCKKLVALARKYNVLILSEDIYNLVHYSDGFARPHLLTYDDPSDSDYQGGHVLSNGTFSKILAPALRLGWIEGPKLLIELLTYSQTSLSGGAIQHYVSQLMTYLLKSGLQTEHIKRIRKVYERRMDALCQILKENLPDGCSFVKPEGGYFLWVQLNPEVDAGEFCNYTLTNYNIQFLPGKESSPSGGFKNFLRLSISRNKEEDLIREAKVLCQAYKKFRQNLTG